MALLKSLKMDPKGFSPYKIVDICGVILCGVRYLIEVNGNHPVLLGCGPKPRVWIYAPKNDKLTKWIPIIKDSRTEIDQAHISYIEGHKQKIMLGVICLISIVAHNENSIVIDELDLRPIGFDVVGKKDHIKAGGTKVSGVRIDGARALFNLS